MSKTKLSLVTVTVYLLISTFCLADWRDNAKVKMLGAGESHSLFLTSDDTLWYEGELSDYITEEEYLKFRNDLENMD